MSKLELMTVLENDGWSFQQYKSKKDVGDLAAPYVAGSRKIWLFKVKDNVVELKVVMAAYLLCLATADEHGRPVPHFATANEYQLIMDPTFQPKKRRRKKFVEVPMQARCAFNFKTYGNSDPEGRLDWTYDGKYSLVCFLIVSTEQSKLLDLVSLDRVNGAIEISN